MFKLKYLLIIFLLIFITTNVLATCTTDGFAKVQVITLNTDGIGLSGNITNDHIQYFDINADQTTFWANIDSNGNDVRFYNNAEDATYNFGFENWNYAGQDTNVWVGITDTFPSGSDFQLKLCYDKVGAINESSPASSYPASYVSVWHMGVIQDSTSNENNWTNYNGASVVDGKIGKAYNFNGSNQDLSQTFDASFNLTTFSIINWAKLDDTAGGDYILTRGDHSHTTATDKTYEWGTRPTSALRLREQESQIFLSGNGQYSATTWFMNIIAHDNAASPDLEAYVNGASIGTGTGTVATDADAGLTLGSNVGLNGFLGGTIDEVKILNYKISDDEAKLLFASENKTNGYVTFGAITTGITANFTNQINIIDQNIEYIDTTTNTNQATPITLDDWNWYVDSVLTSTDQNWTQTEVSEYQDYNIALSVCGDYTGSEYCSYVEKTVSTGKFFGDLIFNFYDDTAETGLDQVYLEFDGNAYYSDTNTFINIDLQGISSGSHSILMQVTGYQEKDFELILTQYTDVNYNMGFVSSSTLSDVAFQVFTETGAIKPNTTFFGYDNDNNYLIDVKTTDVAGKMNFYLNNNKSDYNFVSTDLNFATTTWTINKPKDTITLNDINYNWEYSITGNSYSSATNIASGITKLLLQNTVNPYYIKIQDVNNAYYTSNFGLQSITSEKTKILNPYLYPLGSADLVLIKLLDFTTNQPIATFNELALSLYTDSNGLIEIGTFINDSTGTYNIYMDANAKYQLIINEQTFILNPTLSIYYLYLVESSGLDITNNVNVITNDYIDLNSPTIMLEVREYFFGCSISEENCYPSMVFSLVMLVILAIGFSLYLTVGSLEQSILIFVLLAMFTFIGFIPIWLFAISAVIAFMWGVFS